MARWVILAGIATILIALVALASLAGAPDRQPVEEAQSEPVPLEEPEAPAPATTTQQTQQQETGQEGQTTQEDQPVQGIRPGQELPGPGPRIATVRITGDADYSCSIGRIDSPRTVRGENPATYQVRAARGGSSLDTVMAVCQKISGDDLNVGIVYAGEVRAQGDTTARFGTVSVSWSPMQE